MENEKQSAKFPDIDEAVATLLRLSGNETPADEDLKDAIVALGALMVYDLRRIAVALETIALMQAETVALTLGTRNS